MPTPVPLSDDVAPSTSAQQLFPGFKHTYHDSYWLWHGRRGSRRMRLRVYNVGGFPRWQLGIEPSYPHNLSDYPQAFIKPYVSQATISLYNSIPDYLNLSRWIPSSKSFSLPALPLLCEPPQPLDRLSPSFSPFLAPTPSLDPTKTTQTRPQIRETLRPSRGCRRLKGNQQDHREGQQRADEHAIVGGEGRCV